MTTREQRVKVFALSGAGDGQWISHGTGHATFLPDTGGKASSIFVQFDPSDNKVPSLTLEIDPRDSYKLEGEGGSIIQVERSDHRDVAFSFKTAQSAEQCWDGICKTLGLQVGARATPGDSLLPLQSHNALFCSELANRGLQFELDAEKRSRAQAEVRERADVSEREGTTREKENVTRERDAARLQADAYRLQAEAVTRERDAYRLQADAYRLQADAYRLQAEAMTRERDAVRLQADAVTRFQAEAYNRELESLRASSSTTTERAVEKAKKSQLEAFNREKAEALERRDWLRSPEAVLTVLTITAQNGYSAKGFKNLSRPFRYDEQLWDATKDRRGPNGWTSLMVAAMKGDKERVRWLLKRSASVNAATANNETPLTLACQKGHLEIVRLLLDKGANAATVNAATVGTGFTPLLWACQKGHLEIAQLLLQKGADVNTTQVGNGRTALSWASAGKKSVGIVRLLLEKNANVNAAQTDTGLTALLWAVIEGHVETVQLLINKGAHVNTVTTDTGTTALILACKYGRTEISKHLIAGGADVNASSAHDGTTALMCAAKHGNLKIVQHLLLNDDVEKDAVDASNRTAREYATTLDMKHALRG